MRVIVLSVALVLVSLNGFSQIGRQSWKILYDSTQHYWAKDWDTTIDLLASAEKVAVADVGIYDENYLTIVNDLGLAYWKIKDYQNAEKYLARSIRLRSEAYEGLSDSKVASMSNLASMYSDKGDHAKARALYESILSLTDLPTASDYFMNAARNVVSLLEMEKKYNLALLTIDEVQRKVPLNQYHFDRELELMKGRQLRLLKNFEASKEILDNVEGKLSEPDFVYTDLQIQFIQESGLLNLETGFYNKAEKQFLEGLRLLKSGVAEIKLKIEILNNLGNVYDKLNINEKALAYYIQARQHCINTYGENSIACAILENNIAGIYLKEGEFTKAIESYELVLRALKDFVKDSDPLYISALSNAATAYRNNGDFSVAAEYLDVALALIRTHKLNDEDIAAIVLNNIAVLNTSEGDFQKAADFYAEAYKIKKNIYGEQSLMLRELLSNIAVVNWALGKPETSVPFLKKSMELTRRQVKYVFPALNENEQLQFYKNLKEDFERFNTIALQWSHHDKDLIVQVFNNQLLIKSLMFFSQQKRNRLIASTGDSTLYHLQESLKEKRQQLGHLYQLSLGELANARVSVEAVEKEIEELEKGISLKTSDIGDDMFTSDADWHAIKSLLAPDEALVEMIRFRKYDVLKNAQTSRSTFGFTDSVYYAAIIARSDKEMPQSVLLKNGADLESRYFAYYRNALQYSVPDEYSFNAYWKPFSELVSDKTKINISSDGVYHKMNPGTLHDPISGQYLLQRHDIVQLLSPAQILNRNNPVEIADNSAVLMGDPVFDKNSTIQREKQSADNALFAPLPGTNQELVTIDRLLKNSNWQTSLYLRSDARESNLKNVHSPGILHIATHGFFSSDIIQLNEQAKNNFLFHSGLVLSGANDHTVETEVSGNDGIITAFDVMNLELTNTRLVVLSACDTGLGKIENGEGVYGLQRSFLQAGAQQVLITLWKVEDQFTKELMIKFYQHLTVGKSPHESLKLAQMELSTDPYQWGAFVLIGSN